MAIDLRRKRALIFGLAAILVAATVVVVALLARRSEPADAAAGASSTADAQPALSDREKLELLHDKLEQESRQLNEEAAREEREARRKDFEELKTRIKLTEKQSVEVWPVFSEDVPTSQGRKALEKVLTPRQLEQYDDFMLELEEREASKDPSEHAAFLVKRLGIDPKKEEQLVDALSELEIGAIARVDRRGDDYEGLLKDEMAEAKKLLEPILTKAEFRRYSEYIERSVARKIARQRLLEEEAR
jgi:hypothetical protein